MTRPIRSDGIDPISRRRLPVYLTGLDSLADWHGDAACAGVDAEQFFPTGRGQARQALLAQRICAECPVADQCREHALTLPEPFGVWGGMTARERGWDAWGKRLRDNASDEVLPAAS